MRFWLNNCRWLTNPRTRFLSTIFMSARGWLLNTYLNIKIIIKHCQLLSNLVLLLLLLLTFSLLIYSSVWIWARFSWSSLFLLFSRWSLWLHWLLIINYHRLYNKTRTLGFTFDRWSNLDWIFLLTVNLTEVEVIRVSCTGSLFFFHVFYLDRWWGMRNWRNESLYIKMAIIIFLAHFFSRRTQFLGR